MFTFMPIELHVNHHGRMYGRQRLFITVLLAAVLAVSVFNPVLAAVATTSALTTLEFKVFSPFLSNAAALATTTTTTTVVAAGDAYVSSNSPTTTYGSASTFSSDGSPVEQSFVRFKADTFAGTVTSAKLRLYVTNGSAAAGGTVRSMSNTTWNESSVTYNTRPAIDGVQVGSFNQITAGARVEFDVTAVVRAPGVYSFGIRQTGSDGVDFASREHSTSSYRPQLVLTISATPTPTPSPTPSPTPTPSPAPAPATGSGIWISREEIMARPTSGDAWNAIKRTADSSIGTANIADQNSDHDVRTIAVALVYARTGDVRYRVKAADAIMAAIGTESGARTLAVGRNLAGYVIAADLIDLRSYDAAKETRFRGWLSTMRSKTFDGGSLISRHERDPNNWGTHAGASRIAVARYLGDTTDLARAARVFKGWLGDRASYAGFSYGDPSWQCNASAPVGINPKGCTKNGRNIDGVLPEEMRRAGSFTWPPPKENYVYTALDGVLVQANVLARAGYDAWNWQDQAIKRAYIWLHTQANHPAVGNDEWQPHLVNKIYGTSFPATPARPGKSMGWTDWTHAR